MFSLFQKIPTISTQELAKKLRDNIKLLDVRTPQEYRSGHIAKAKNIPLNKVGGYTAKADRVYVICQSGMRSKQAAKVLMKKGYDVVNVRGGMNLWTGRTVGGK